MLVQSSIYGIFFIFQNKYINEFFIVFNLSMTHSYIYHVWELYADNKDEESELNNARNLAEYIPAFYSPVQPRGTERISA